MAGSGARGAGWLQPRSRISQFYRCGRWNDMVCVKRCRGGASSTIGPQAVGHRLTVGYQVTGRHSARVACVSRSATPRFHHKAHDQSRHRKGALGNCTSGFAVAAGRRTGDGAVATGAQRRVDAVLLIAFERRRRASIRSVTDYNHSRRAGGLRERPH